LNVTVSKMLALTPAQYAAALVPIPRARGCTRVCVQEGFGAKGDGTTDDTAAFQAAIDALPAAGGTVHVPAGHYMIDSAKSVRLRSLMLLDLDPEAYLHALPNTVKRDYVVLAQDLHDIEIHNANIIGDLDSFVPQAGTTSEWGHGIAVYACTRVTILGVRASKCVGDGISIGGSKPCTDVQILDMVSDGNRRQGCSIVNADGITVSGTFCNTGRVQGTDPRCGIDVEPELGQVCKNVRLLNVDAYGNARFGINILQRASAGIVDGVLVQGCHVHEGLSNGIETNGGSNVNIDSSLIEFNSASGIDTSATAGLAIQRCTFRSNYTRNGIKTRVPFDQTGTSPKTASDILVRGTLNGVIGVDHFA
jgi:hypothetical protein